MNIRKIIGQAIGRLVCHDGHDSEPQRTVALVLGGGGARGYAHIGAIEALEEEGYTIAAVAGTSMGALVGGLYAAGKLKDLKQKVLQLNRKRIVSLINISPGLDHLATGRRLQELLDKLTDGIDIADLKIPFCCCASNLASGREIVFRQGCLKDAIRASISIPGFFSPVEQGRMLLVDGSVHNTLPLNRVRRTPGDMLVAVNASAPYEQPFHDDSRLSRNYMRMAIRVSEVTVMNNTLMAETITPPDICVDVPTDRFSLFDFNKGEEIIAYGYRKMKRALRNMKEQQQRKNK